MGGKGDGSDGGVVVSVVVVGVGGRGEATSVDGLFESAVRHSGGTVDHRDPSKGMEETRNVFSFGILCRVVGIKIGEADEARGRVVVARDTAHERAGAEGGEVGISPRDFFWHTAVKVKIIAEVLVVPIVAWLVGQDIDIVMEDFHAVFSIFDNNTAVLISDNPME